MNIKQQDNQASTDPTRGTWHFPDITYKYDDFTPAHDWSAGDGSYILRIALPGFTAKQIETSLDPAGIIKVSGSLFVGNLTYSRFNSEFRIPEDGSKTGIRKKFANGILYITIPKKNPFRSETLKEEANLTSAEARSGPPQSLIPSKPSESQLARPFSPTKQTAKQTQLDPPPQQSSPQPQIQSDPRTKANTLGVETDKMLSRTHIQEPSEKFSSENHEKEQKESENPESHAEKIPKPSATVGTAEEMETPRKEHLDNEARQKPALTDAKVPGESMFESYIKLAREQLSGERRTVLNVGAAMLVIAGLGVYVCCKIQRKINTK